MTENITAIAKFNFWNGNKLDLGFERKEYLEKVTRFSGNRLIKVLVGQRRTGKSYLLRQIVGQVIQSGVPPQNTLYINKEFVEFDFLTDYKALASLVDAYKADLKPVGKVYLFLDEIQTIEGWERLVDSYSQDFADSYELYISGSNSQMLSGELATLLSGRYVSFQIYPFSFPEFCEFKQVEQSKISYLDYLQTGALPELFHLPEPETKRHYVSAIKDTVLLRDIIQRYNIKDAKLLEDIFVYLVNNASTLVSISNIVNYFQSKNRKTNYETVANYILYIENTFLVHRTERYNIKGKEIVSGTYKFYINDLAFKNYLYSGFGYGISYLLENAVFLQIRQAGYEVFVGATRKGEIDFVAKKADHILYFQVTYLLADEQTVKREYGAFNSINDNYEKFVVSLDDIEFPSNAGIKHIQAWKLEGLL
ncbi:MAG TPA: AAA family ATPase [Prolixibacteraceae bacterium]|nr:AAA family ATPase [Prolixibacteraceae bacterium]